MIKALYYNQMEISTKHALTILCFIIFCMETQSLHFQSAPLYVDNLQQSNLNYYFAGMSPSSYYSNLNQFRIANPSAQSCAPSFPYANYTNKNLSCFACDPLTNDPNLKQSKVLFNLLTRDCEKCIINKTETCNKILNGTFSIAPSNASSSTTNTTTTTTPPSSTQNTNSTSNTTQASSNTSSNPTTPTTSPATTSNTTNNTTSSTSNTTSNSTSPTASNSSSNTSTTANTTSTTSTNPSNASSTTNSTSTPTTQPSNSTVPSNASTPTSTNSTTNTTTANSTITTTTSSISAEEAAKIKSSLTSNPCKDPRPFFNKSTGLCDACSPGTQFVTSQQMCLAIVYVTNPSAPNTILSTPSQLIDINLAKQKQNPEQTVQFCPPEKPYASKSCISCQPGQYFYVSKGQCVTGCPEGTYYDSNLGACSPAIYYSDVHAPWIVSQQGNYQNWKIQVENKAKSSPRMILCPKDKPFEVNGVCITCPSGTYFNIDQNKCLACGKNRSYNPNERKCIGVVNYKHSMKTFASTVV